MALSKGTKAALGSTLLALAAVVLIGASEPTDANSITVYKSPT